MAEQTNMRPEDRLAEKLKNDTLGTFFSDEDLLPLARRAIEIAFFQPRKGPSYNSPDLPPLIAEMAKKQIEVKIQQWVDTHWDTLYNDERFKESIGETMAASLGILLERRLTMRWDQQFQDTLMKNTSMIKNILNNS